MPYALSRRAATQLARTRREVARRTRNGPGHRGSKPPGAQPFLEGKLDGALAANGTATLSVYRGAGASWADSGVNVTVKERRGCAYESGDYLLCARINGEIRPVMGG